MAEYFRVKASFAAKVASQHVARADMGRADLPPYVVCLDGENGREMFDAVGNFAVNAIPVTVRRPAFDLAGLQLAGDYNKSNVLVAAALAEAAHVPHDVVQRVILTLRPRWGRLERVACPHAQAAVYVDFAHTPDGLEKVLSAARGFTRGRLWVVFGAGGCGVPCGSAMADRAAIPTKAMTKAILSCFIILFPYMGRLTIPFATENP